MKVSYWEILVHLLFWSICYGVLLQAFSFSNQYVEVLNGIRTTRTQTTYLFFPVFFFLVARATEVYWNISRLLPQYLKQKNWKNYGLRLTLVLLLGVGLENGLNYVFNLSPQSHSVHPFLIGFSIRWLFSGIFWGLSCAYVLGKHYVVQERLQQQLVQEKLSAELQFLKAQIHPHFLFNTLNNLFALAERSHNQQLSQGISELSNLMRYMLYDAKAACVALEKEVAYLKSVIEIQQLRLSEEDDILIVFNVIGLTEQQQIAPLILIPFVENAFKHGIDTRKSSFIKIDLTIEDEVLIFKVINSRFSTNRAAIKEHSGIGLENVKRRLQLIYPDRHQLRITAHEQVFDVLLELHL